MVWRKVPGIDDEEIYKMLQLFSLHGQSKDALEKTKLGAWEYNIVGPWYKCNMTDIAAALGLAQLERYGEMQKAGAHSFLRFRFFKDGNKGAFALYGRI